MIHEALRTKEDGVVNDMKERVENGDKAGKGISVEPHEGPTVVTT